MPFTFSHVAAVLPLLRRRPSRWSATGLIAGSMAPDFEKFMRLGAHNDHSHSLASLLYFSCPVALGLAFLFHGVVRRPLLAHLPHVLHRRLSRYQHLAWGPYFRRRYGRVLLSIVLGGATHLVWDSFTHRRGELVQLLPGLRAVWHVGRVYAPGFVMVNALSTLLGLLLLALAMGQLPPVAAPRPPALARVLFWLLAGVVAAGVVGGRLLLADYSLKNIDVLISIVAGGLAGLGAASLCFHLLGASPAPVPVPARR
jgi:hypothetical protein